MLFLLAGLAHTVIGAGATLTEHYQLARQQAAIRNQSGTCRIAIGVEYNGRHFHGWQRQASPAVATVQQMLEAALAKVADQPVVVQCAGRTDAGVHALGQVAHFDVAIDRGERAWVLGTNSHLPDSVRVVWARAVAPDFHARYSAITRRYQYWIDNGSIATAVFAGQLTHWPYPLDAQLMHKEAQALLGEQDFSAFRAAACQSNSPMRNVHALAVTRLDQRLCIDITANAFLLHMVRNITGALLEVGAGRREPGWLAGLLAERDRRMAPATARPDGLYLHSVRYPPGFGLPDPSRALFATGSALENA